MHQNPKKLIKNQTANTCKTEGCYKLYPVPGKKTRATIANTGKGVCMHACMAKGNGHHFADHLTTFYSTCIYSGFLHFLLFLII